MPRISGRLSGANPVDTAGSVRELDSRKGVQSVEHAFSILQIFQETNSSLAVKEIAEKSGMPSSKVHHYLVSLVRCGVVQRSIDGRYELGAYALQLGLSALRRLDAFEVAEKRSKQLRDETGEATFLSVWGSYGPTIIKYFEGSQPVTVEAKTGNVLPLATSATGKVFVSWGSPALIETILERENISRSKIAQIRQETRRSKLARVEGDLLPRISALAAPVFDRDGELALSITQLGWAGEFDSRVNGKPGLALIQATEQMSANLGYMIPS